MYPKLRDKYQKILLGFKIVLLLFQNPILIGHNIRSVYSFKFLIETSKSLRLSIFKTTLPTLGMPTLIQTKTEGEREIEKNLKRIKQGCQQQ